MTFFRFFVGIEPTVKFVPLYAPAAVNCRSYHKEQKRSFGADKAFSEKHCIDILVMTPSDADDTDGLLHRFLTERSPQTIDKLQKKEWKGELMFLPFSNEGFLSMTSGQRVVTVFEWEELVDIACKQTNRFVVVVVPCRRQTKQPRLTAIRALLESDANRVFTHLVTDVATCRKLLADPMKK